jgi:cellobiose-specific phosphotransferase system component IIB
MYIYIYIFTSSTDHIADSKKKTASSWLHASTEIKAAILSSLESQVDSVFILPQTEKINKKINKKVNRNKVNTLKLYQ